MRIPYAGPLLKALELQGATDADVAAMGFMMKEPALLPAAALQVIFTLIHRGKKVHFTLHILTLSYCIQLARETQEHENASRNFYSDFKSIDRQYLKPLFGGRTSSYPLATGEDEGLLGEDDDDDRTDNLPHRGGPYSSGAFHDSAPQQGGYQGLSATAVADVEAPNGIAHNRQTSQEVPLASLDPGWNKEQDQG